MNLVLIQQIQRLKRQVAANKLPVGTVLSSLPQMAPPANTVPMDGSVTDVQRFLYPELDAISPFPAGTVLGAEMLNVPGLGPSNRLYWLGDCYASHRDGGIVWWDAGTGALVHEQIYNQNQGPAFVLACTVVSGVNRSNTHHFALVMCYPTASNAHLEFYHTTGTNNEIWTLLDIFPLAPGHYNLYRDAPDNLMECNLYMASWGGRYIYFILRNTDTNCGEIYAWNVQSWAATDPSSIVRLGGYHPNDSDGFMSPVLPVLQFIDDQIVVIVDLSVNAPVTLRVYDAGPDTDPGNPVSAYAKMMMFNSTGYPVAMGQTGGSRNYFVVPTVSSAQSSWPAFKLKDNLFIAQDLQDTFAAQFQYLGLYGGTWNRFHSNVDSTFHLTGGQKTLEDGEGNTTSYPLLLAAWGFRNWHPITHSVFNTLVDGVFYSGMQVQDPAHTDETVFLMLLEVPDESPAYHIVKIRLSSDLGGQITIPSLPGANGLVNYLYTGPALPNSQPGGGEGVE